MRALALAAVVALGGCWPSWALRCDPNQAACPAGYHCPQGGGWCKRDKR